MKITAALAFAAALVGQSVFQGVAAERNDYRNPAFAARLDAGLRAFYARHFADAEHRFAAALEVVPDNTLALGFLNAAAMKSPGELSALIAEEERAVRDTPRGADAHLRLAFSLLMQASRVQSSAPLRQEISAARDLDPRSAGPDVAAGIIDYREGYKNRAKLAFAAALGKDRWNVLAREYLSQLYQTELRDPQQALAYLVPVANLVPHYADVNFHLASLLYELKQYDAAVRYATRALESDTGSVGEAGTYGLTLLGRIYLDQHRIEDARRVLRAAVRKDSDAAFARVLLAKIANGDYDVTSR